MVQNGLVKKNEKVKILSTGEYNASLDVFAHKFSASSKKDH